MAAELISANTITLVYANFSITFAQKLTFYRELCKIQYFQQFMQSSLREFCQL